MIRKINLNNNNYISFGISATKHTPHHINYNNNNNNNDDDDDDDVDVDDNSYYYI